MFNAKESICIAVTRKKLQSKLISRMMMDNILLAWTHSFKYLEINFQAKGFIQVDCLAIKRKFYSLYNRRPIFQRSASAAEPVLLQLVIRLECIRGVLCINFIGQKNGLHASGYNWAESKPIWMKFGTSWDKCWGLALADFGRDPRSSDSMPTYLVWKSYTQYTI